MRSVVALLLVACPAFVLSSQSLSFPSKSYSSSSFQGIGDRLLRTYTRYVDMPSNVSAALESGWQQSGSSCVPGLGVAYNYGSSGPLQDSPVTIYFTPAGQASAVQVNLWGTPAQNLIQKGFWRQTSSSSNGDYFLVVSFRSVDASCSSKNSPQYLGDRLVINADTKQAFSIPTTLVGAEKALYQKGACFWGMGHHYFLDLKNAPQMSWEAAELLPVVPMYTVNGTLNAFFFASSVVQQGVFNTHWWEPIPLADFMMCKNFCNSNCTFTDTNFWSTMHIYMNDINQVECANDCQVACCP